MQWTNDYQNGCSIDLACCSCPGTGPPPRIRSCCWRKALKSDEDSSSDVDADAADGSCDDDDAAALWVISSTFFVALIIANSSSARARLLFALRRSSSSSVWLIGRTGLVRTRSEKSSAPLSSCSTGMFWSIAFFKISLQGLILTTLSEENSPVKYTRTFHLSHVNTLRYADVFISCEWLGFIKLDFESAPGHGYEFQGDTLFQLSDPHYIYWMFPCISIWNEEGKQLPCGRPEPCLWSAKFFL